MPKQIKLNGSNNSWLLQYRMHIYTQPSQQYNVKNSLKIPEVVIRRSCNAK